MTSLKGDLRSIMGTPFGGVGHAVLIFSRVTRAAFNSDSVVLQLHDRIEMPEEADGKFRVDGLDPGPIRIELEGGTVHNHGWNIDLPDEGVWSLTDLVDAQVDWSPAVIGRAEAAARESREHADRAEAGADRVGTAEQVGVWASEASASASDASSARYGALTARDAARTASDAAEGHANRAATSETNAAASETNAKQSETNAGDYAAVATTAATEAVDAMERATDLAGGDFATHEYVDGALALKADKTYVDQRLPFLLLTGTGSPEGKVTAPVGSIYTDSVATNGAIRWVKTSSAGSTGWRVEHGDTGWREVIPINGWTGNIYVRRTNSTVFYRGKIDAKTATSGNAWDIPAGFRIGNLLSTQGQGYEYGRAMVSTDENEPKIRNVNFYFSRFSINGYSTAHVYGINVSYPTSIEWPASLPGTPV